MATWTRAAVAALTDHTLLRPEVTREDVWRHCGEGIALGVAGVCVSPSLVGDAAAAVGELGVDGAPVVVCVVGFPSGAHPPEVKVREADVAVARGARELDMVIDLGRAAEGDLDGVADEVAAVRAAAGPDTVLKAILESALWDDDRLAALCRAAVEGGADLVKTSTGFHPAGGATPHAVSVMRRAVGQPRGVKASGGIGDASGAVALLDAGASRLGTSRTAAVLAGLPESPSGAADR